MASLAKDGAAANGSNSAVGLGSNLMGAKAAMVSRKKLTVSIHMSFLVAEIDASSTNTGISVSSGEKKVKEKEK